MQTTVMVEGTVACMCTILYHTHYLGGVYGDGEKDGEKEFNLASPA